MDDKKITINLGVLPDDFDEFRKEMQRSQELQEATGKEMPCRCCGKPFTVPAWCFYGLCDPCFLEYDAYKMNRRMQNMFGGASLSESCDAWIAQKRDAK